jgi:SAM-dependent methyltransferase
LSGHDPLVPPRGLQAVGAGDFESVGRDFLRLFREAGLRPSDRVLDVGCGVGRMAVPLAGFLDGPGSYDGFDVSRADVAWCRRALSSRFPRFRFVHADVANSEYNPRGRVAPAAFVFPYPDHGFDFVFATSVFTHLLPEAAGRYLREIERVLAPEGRFYCTAFLLDETADAAIAAGRTLHRFESEIDGAFVHDPRSPESAVAYETTAFRRMLERAGLAVHVFERGTWAGGRSASFQDVVVAVRLPLQDRRRAEPEEHRAERP